MLWCSTSRPYMWHCAPVPASNGGGAPLLAQHEAILQLPLQLLVVVELTRHDLCKSGGAD